MQLPMKRAPFCRTCTTSLGNTGWKGQHFPFNQKFKTHGRRYWLYPSSHRLQNNLNCPQIHENVERKPLAAKCITLYAMYNLSDFETTF